MSLFSCCKCYWRCGCDVYTDDRLNTRPWWRRWRWRWRRQRRRQQRTETDKRHTRTAVQTTLNTVTGERCRAPGRRAWRRFPVNNGDVLVLVNRTPNGWGAQRGTFLTESAREYDCDGNTKFSTAMLGRLDRRRCVSVWTKKYYYNIVVSSGPGMRRVSLASGQTAKISSAAAVTSISTPSPITPPNHRRRVVFTIV